MEQDEYETLQELERKVEVLNDKLVQLQVEQTLPKTRVDIADLIADHFVEIDGNIEVLNVEDDHSGPMGGISTQVVLKVHNYKRNTFKYMIVNIYDDEQVQKRVAGIIQRKTAEIRLEEARHSPF